MSSPFSLTQGALITFLFWALTTLNYQLWENYIALIAWAFVLAEGLRDPREKWLVWITGANLVPSVRYDR